MGLFEMVLDERGESLAGGLEHLLVGGYNLGCQDGLRRDLLEGNIGVRRLPFPLQLAQARFDARQAGLFFIDPGCQFHPLQAQHSAHFGG